MAIWKIKLVLDCWTMIFRRFHPGTTFRMLRMSKLRAVWERVEVRIGSIAIIQSIMSLGYGDAEDDGRVCNPHGYRDL